MLKQSLMPQCGTRDNENRSGLPRTKLLQANLRLYREGELVLGSSLIFGATSWTLPHWKSKATMEIPWSMVVVALPEEPKIARFIRPFHSVRQIRRDECE